MNTSKQINVMLVLVFVAVLLTGAYSLWDPERAEEAEGEQLEEQIERAAFLFSANCRTCHGDSGEGGAESNRLRQAPALNRPDLQGRDAEGVLDELEKQKRYKEIFFTISCGRVGAFMPAWSQVQGGPLTDEQIKLLTILITEGTGWEEAKHFAIRGNHLGHDPGDDRLHLSLVDAIDENATTFALNGDVGLLAVGNRLSIEREVEIEVSEPSEGGEADEGGESGEEGEEDAEEPETEKTYELVELMEITAVDAEAKTVTVERGLGRSEPAAHEAGTEVFAPPSPPEPAVTERTCGQTGGAGGGGDEFPAATTTPRIVADNIAWDLSRIAVPAGQEITLTVDNQEEGVPHNFVLFTSPDPDEVMAQTEIENGPVTQTLTFGPLTAGDYFYYCEVHPQMEGLLRAVEEGAAPAEGEATPDPTP